MFNKMFLLWLHLHRHRDCSSHCSFVALPLAPTKDILNCHIGILCSHVTSATNIERTNRLGVLLSNIVFAQNDRHSLRNWDVRWAESQLFYTAVGIHSKCQRVFCVLCTWSRCMLCCMYVIQQSDPIVKQPKQYRFCDLWIDILDQKSAVLYQQ